MSVRRPIVRSHALVVFSLATASCSSTPRPDVRPQPTETPTTSFWLYSDPQLHALTGATAFSKSWRADKSVGKSAIRPPTLDLWSEVVLANVVQQMSVDQRPALFLGDAANVSCISEYARYLQTMGPKTWFGVPGNHDGFYMGNLTFLPVDATGDGSWAGTCAADGVSTDPASNNELAALETAFWKLSPTHAAQGVLTKSHVIWMYLAHLHGRSPFRGSTGGIVDPLKPASWTCTPSADDCKYRVFEGTSTYDDGRAPRAVAVSAHVSGSTVDATSGVHPWNAWIVQDIELDENVHALLLDTSDYMNLPPGATLLGIAAYAEQAGYALMGTLLGFVQVDFHARCRWYRSDQSLPGVCGEISAAQVRRATELIDGARRKNAKLRYFALGHHPWVDMRKDTTIRVKAMLEGSPGFVTYISGHTHYPNATVAPKGVPFREINVASTTDWPMQFAHVDYWDRPAPDQHQLKVVNLSAVGATRAERCWYRQAGAAALGPRNQELNYKTPALYLQRAVHSYVRLMGIANAERMRICGADAKCNTELDRLRAIRSGPRPNDELRRDLVDLVAFDRDFLRRSDKVRAVEMDCAAWASEIEYQKDFEQTPTLENGVVVDGEIVVKVNPR
jgi:3',5'-cyclic AMP phosphodiesterase CpdA